MQFHENLDSQFLPCLFARNLQDGTDYYWQNCTISPSNYTNRLVLSSDFPYKVNAYDFSRFDTCQNLSTVFIEKSFWTNLFKSHIHIALREQTEKPKHISHKLTNGVFLLAIFQIENSKPIDIGGTDLLFAPILVNLLYDVKFHSKFKLAYSFANEFPSLVFKIWMYGIEARMVTYLLKWHLPQSPPFLLLIVVFPPHFSMDDWMVLCINNSDQRVRDHCLAFSLWK